MVIPDQAGGVLERGTACEYFWAFKYSGGIVRKHEM